MPKTVPPEFNQQANSLQNKPIHLYTVYDYDGAGSNLYFAEYDTDITFNGITYSRFPISYDNIGENNRGQIDQVTVSISNVNRLIQGYLEQYDFRGKKVSIKTVWADALGDTDNLIEETYFIDSYSSDESTVGFMLTSKFDVLDLSLPLRSYSRNYCQWKFKGTECGYAGGETSCNKTKQRCKALSNFSRFGGFPSVQPNRVSLG